MYALPVALLALFVAAAVLKCGAIARTIVLLLANWAVNTGFVSGLQDTTPWLLFLVTDYLAALGVFVVWRSHWQSAVIAVYAFECIAHAGFGASSGGAWAVYRYYWSLFALGWAQTLICGGWLGYEMARHRLGAGGRVALGVALAREEARP